MTENKTISAFKDSLESIDLINAVYIAKYIIDSLENEKNNGETIILGLVVAAYVIAITEIVIKHIRARTI